MNKKEKIEFIESIMDTVKENLLKNIDKYPGNWDGKQLRQYISDYVDENVAWVTMTSKEKREYNNDILINSL